MAVKRRYWNAHSAGPLVVVRTESHSSPCANKYHALRSRHSRHSPTGSYDRGSYAHMTSARNIALDLFLRYMASNRFMNAQRFCPHVLPPLTPAGSCRLRMARVSPACSYSRMNPFGARATLLTPNSAASRSKAWACAYDIQRGSDILRGRT